MKPSKLRKLARLAGNNASACEAQKQLFLRKRLRKSTKHEEAMLLFGRLAPLKY
jgi:hypothetical protein